MRKNTAKIDQKADICSQVSTIVNTSHTMIHIGLLSDTHGHFDESLALFFEPCKEIWHAGDIGNAETATQIEALKPLMAVHGNIDDHNLRLRFPATQRFMCEDVDVLITHIGGYPGNYAPAMRKVLQTNAPKLYICGHSHILKVIYDKKLGMLHINPGAAGISGFHKVRTAMRFIIDGSDIKQLEIWEKER